MRGIEPAGCEFSVSGGGSGFQQSLELPWFGPTSPIGLVRVECAHERPVAALGSEVGIDAETATSDLHDRTRSSIEPVAGTFADEEDVDVARVVELGPAEFAHAEDGERQAVGSVAVAGGGKSGGRSQNLPTECGEVPAHLFELVVAEEVARCDAEKLEIAPGHQTIGGGIVDVGAPPEVGKDGEGRVWRGFDDTGHRAAGSQHSDDRSE